MLASLSRSTMRQFPHLNWLQEEMQQIFGGALSPSSIRAVARGSFPAINIGSTPQSIEVYAFAPGLSAASFEVTIDRGLLTIAGERNSEIASDDDTLTTQTYSSERYSGKFRRTLTLPDEIDASQVEARYVDGILHISLRRMEAAPAKRVEVR